MLQFSFCLAISTVIYMQFAVAQQISATCQQTGTPMCDSTMKCCAIERFPGGFGTCFRNMCLCRLNTFCTNDSQCCSGTCFTNSCTSNLDGEACYNNGTDDSCAPPGYCKTPHPVQNVAEVLKEAGICQVDTCMPLGRQCLFDEVKTQCCTYGNYDGKGCLSHERLSICGCKTGGSDCQTNSDCCSGTCDDDSKCGKDQAGDICSGQSCENGFYCRNSTPHKEPYVQRLQGTLQKQLGICERCQTYGTPFEAPTSKRCPCKLTDGCLSNSHCCTGSCDLGTTECAKGKTGQPCEKGTCDSNNFCELQKDSNYGVCKFCIELGLESDGKHKCCPYGSYNGTEMITVKGKQICGCFAYDRYCKRNSECCSGTCTNAKCTKGDLDDLCIDRGCDSNNDPPKLHPSFYCFLPKPESNANIRRLSELTGIHHGHCRLYIKR